MKPIWELDFWKTILFSLIQIVAGFLCGAIVGISKGEKPYSRSRTNYNRLEQLGSTQGTVSQLSSGIKRRVAITRVLMLPYDLLILDEAFKGVDEETEPMVIKCVREHSKEKTVVCVIHESQKVTYFSEEIIKL